MRCSLCTRSVRFHGDLCKSCLKDPANSDWMNKEETVINTSLPTGDANFADILDSAEDKEALKLEDDEKLVISCVLIYHMRKHKRINYHAFVNMFGRCTTPQRFRYILGKFFVK